jgi:hypothetical protein
VRRAEEARGSGNSACNVQSRSLAVVLLLVGWSVTCVWSLGSSRFRLEGGYVLSNRAEISGLVDITRWLTARVCLADAWWSSDSRASDVGVSFALPGGAEFSPLNEASLVLSPWRDRLKVKPYAFAGAGLYLERHYNAAHQMGTLTMSARANYGLGVEPLLFFWPRLPSLFLELGESVSGSNMVIFGNSGDSGSPWLPYLKPEVRIAVGLRI